MGDGDNVRTGLVVALVGLAGYVVYKNRKLLESAGTAVSNAGSVVGSAAGAVGDAVSAPFRAAADAGRTTTERFISWTTGARYASDDDWADMQARQDDREQHKRDNPGSTDADWLVQQTKDIPVPQPSYARYDQADPSTWPKLVYDPRTRTMMLPEDARRKREEDARRKREEDARRKREAGYRPTPAVWNYMVGPESEQKRAGRYTYRGEGVYTREDGSYDVVRDGQVVGGGSAGAVAGLKARAARQNADYYPGTKYLRSVVQKYVRNARSGSKASLSWLKRYAPGAVAEV